MNIIVAIDEAGGFAKNHEIPWKTEPFSKTDFKHFQKVTKDSICIMGRNTYEEIVEIAKKRGKPITNSVLPNRECFVLSSKADFVAEGATVKGNLRAATESLDEDEKRSIFVIGGEKLFVEALAWVNKIYITIIPGQYGCDKFFPMDYVNANFKIINGEKADGLTFVEYERVPK